MNKTIKLIFVIVIIIFILIFFINIAYKSITTGNNISKSNKDLIEYILNISSYEAKLEVTINSNKTTNKYVLDQYYIEPSFSKQIIKEPKNIENLEIIYDGNKLEIKNTNLGLSKIYENYTYINQNLLWLNFFLENCKQKYSIEEKIEEVILTTNIEDYGYIGKLYINKKTSLPSKLQILDNNNQNKIYIEYKEIKLNNIQENNIFAFITKDIKKEV